MRGCVSIAMRASALRGSPWLPVTRISRFSSGIVVGLVLADEFRHGRQIAALARRRFEVAQAAADQRRRCARRPARPARPIRRGRRCWRSRSRRRGPRRSRISAGRLRRTRPPSRNGPPPSHWWSRRPSPARPRRPARANAASSVGGPTSGSGSSFQSPVCSTMPYGGADHQRLRLRDRVRDAQEAQAERRQRRSPRPAGSHAASPGRSNRASASLRRSTAAANGRGIDRAAQLRPQPARRRRYGPRARG